MTGVKSAPKGAKVAEKSAEASVIEHSDCGVLFKNGKLPIPKKPEAVPVDAEVPKEEKVKVGGMNLEGKKKSKKVKNNKQEKTTKEKGKSETPLGAELHVKFSEAILKAVPGSKEVDEGTFSSVKVKDTVICFIRDKRGLSIASKFYNSSKATPIAKETEIAPIVTEIAKNFSTPKEEGQ